MNDSDGAGWALLGIGLLPLVILFIAWLIAAFVAGAIADHRGRSFGAFFAVTLLFLGPLGPGVALLAAREDDGVPVGPTNRLPSEPKKRDVASGRRRFACPRCGADNDIPDTDTSYDCWRCNEHRNVKAKASA